jgi:hypothetical protein
MSSSDSDFEVGENSCFGYQYEPEYTEEELAAAAATQEQKFLSIVYNISTLFVLGEVHNVHRNKSFYQLLHRLHCLLILHQWLQLLLIPLLYTLVHTGNQNRNFLQLQMMNII